MTTPQEEAERRWRKQPVEQWAAHQGSAWRAGFVAGAEWQSERLGPLVEAARAYCDAEARVAEVRERYRYDSEVHEEWAEAIRASNDAHYALHAAAAILVAETVQEGEETQ